MRRKTFTLCALGAIIAAMLGGCVSLAVPDAGEPQTPDRLIGVLITTEDLSVYAEDADWLEDATFSSLAELERALAEHETRVYASLENQPLISEQTGEKVDHYQYVFPEELGYYIFSANVNGDGEGYPVTHTSNHGISEASFGVDSHMVNNKHAVAGITISGKLYITPGPETGFNYNPVYQADDGQVYARPGSSFGEPDESALGSLGSMGYDETSTTTTSDGEEIEYSGSVRVEMVLTARPESYTLTQMDAANNVLQEQEYLPQTLPESVSLLPETAYIIVATHSRGIGGEAVTERQLVDAKAESFSVLRAEENRVCLSQLVELR
jgi:hypothetical protein